MRQVYSVSPGDQQETNTMRTIMQIWLEDLFSLFFPDLCLGCGEPLVKGEQFLCSICQFHLPRTNFQFDADNAVARVFWGRVRLESAASFCYFTKGSNIQRLLHKLKYEGNREIGLYLGETYGRELKASPLFGEIDLIIPVPLHPGKQRKRGYNQSEAIGQGLARAMNAALLTNVLARNTNTSTQTKKTRYKRWENVENVFEVRRPDIIAGKNLLLVDDVITTGATLEACATELLCVKDVRVSVVSIAFASDL